MKSCKKYLSAKLSGSSTSSSSSTPPPSSSFGSKRKISASRSWDSVCCTPKTENGTTKQNKQSGRQPQQPLRASPNLPIALSTAKLLRRHGMHQRPPPVDVREAFRLGRRRAMMDDPTDIRKDDSLKQER